MTDDSKTEAERLDPAEMIDPDDPRYKGFRIREYWMATAIAPDDMEAPLFVTPMMAQMFNLTVGPAFAADERRLKNLRDYAAWSAAQYGVIVYIRHFTPEGEPEVKLPMTRGIASD